MSFRKGSFRSMHVRTTTTGFRTVRATYVRPTVVRSPSMSGMKRILRAFW